MIVIKHDDSNLDVDLNLLHLHLHDQFFLRKVFHKAVVMLIIDENKYFLILKQILPFVFTVAFGAKLFTIDSDCFSSLEFVGIILIKSR